MMHLLFLLNFVTYFAQNCQGVQYGSKFLMDSNINGTNTRRPRLSILHLLAPLSMTDVCKTTTGLVGTCVSVQDCLKRGGRGVETCAWGLGVCCVHSSSCGATSSANTTYFTSPGYPNVWVSNSGVCTFTVKPRRFVKLCQLRLDFEEFYITGPRTGLCSTDVFEVTGEDNNNMIPNICGLNSGQHMYVQVGSSTGPYSFAVKTFSESEERKWRIRVTQIPCASDNLAPSHCLQYFTGTSGKLQSFNYGNTKSVLENTYFVNMNYAICIRKETEMCGAEFNLDGDFNINVSNSSSERCIHDYLSFGTDRKCGTLGAVINGVKMGDAGPIVLTFVSDDKHTDDIARSDSGFSLKYSQFPCPPRR